jgi:hypothetical protein
MGNRMGLVDSAGPRSADIQLLERDDIGRAGGNHLGDASRRQVTVCPEAPPHVVSQDPRHSSAIRRGCVRSVDYPRQELPLTVFARRPDDADALVRTKTSRCCEVRLFIALKAKHQCRRLPGCDSGGGLAPVTDRRAARGLP